VIRRLNEQKIALLLIKNVRFDAMCQIYLSIILCELKRLTLKIEKQIKINK